MSTVQLQPSYSGYVGSTKDALLIIQAILNKQLNLIPRRPHERERNGLIKSGNVFIFIEEHSGIKRWTDGISWSPSRILGRFLVYRELNKDGSDDKKKNKKRKISTEDIMDASTSGFKDQGLIKKTLSITTNLKELNLSSTNEKQTIHLISYYNANDVLNGKLARPSESDLRGLTINNYLWNAIKESNLGGKIPIEDEAYYFLDNNYQLQNMSALQQASQQVQPQHMFPYSGQQHSGNGYPPMFLPQKFGQPTGHHMLPMPSSYDYHKTDDDVTFVNPFNQSNFNLSNNLNSLYHQYDLPHHQQTTNNNMSLRQLQPIQPTASHVQQQYYPFPQHFPQMNGSLSATSDLSLNSNNGSISSVNSGSVSSSSKRSKSQNWLNSYTAISNNDIPSIHSNDSIHHHLHNSAIHEEGNAPYITNYNS